MRTFTIRSSCALLLLQECVALTTKEPNMNLKNPNHVEFVTIEAGSAEANVLRSPTAMLNFPLSEEDKRDIALLKAKFFATENCAGLAAPQIGIGKKIIIYQVDEAVKKWRDDVFEIVAPRVLINPSYKGLEQGKTIDWEACFSVKSQYGEVPRFTTIEFTGFDEQGHRIVEKASGFHARVLQHEIGHINQELFIDLFTKDCRHGDFETMREIRIQELEKKGKNPR